MALMGGAYDILGANGLKEDAAHNQESFDEEHSRWGTMKPFELK